MSDSRMVVDGMQVVPVASGELPPAEVPSTAIRCEVVETPPYPLACRPAVIAVGAARQLGRPRDPAVVQRGGDGAAAAGAGDPRPGAAPTDGEEPRAVGRG